MLAGGVGACAVGRVEEWCTLYIYVRVASLGHPIGRSIPDEGLGSCVSCVIGQHNPGAIVFIESVSVGRSSWTNRGAAGLRTTG